MSREVRRVPANWQHPKNARGYYEPLLGGSYSEAVADWDKANAKWSEGFRECYSGKAQWVKRDETDGETYEDYAGERPTPDEYMPDWPDEERTHLMMYETTSEGTPISPAFATPEELAHWLADSGASAFGDMTASYDAWLATCRQGYTAGSAVMVGGEFISAVEDTLRS